MTVFMSRLGTTGVSVTLGPQGDGTRMVCVWTMTEAGWDQGRPFPVESREAARELVPPSFLRVVNAPPEFEEFWVGGGA